MKKSKYPRDPSAVRFTDSNFFPPRPSSELLGYYHPSAAADWKNDFFAKPHEAGPLCMAVATDRGAETRAAGTLDVAFLVR